MTPTDALGMCLALLSAPPCPLLPRPEDQAGRAAACVQILAEVRS